MIFTIRFNQFLLAIIHEWLYYTLAILYKFTLHLIFLQNTLWFLRYKWMAEKWFYLTWGEFFGNKKVERIEWYKKSKEVLQSKKIIIKKHRECSICDLSRNLFEAATKETCKLTEENPNTEENLWLIDKAISVIQLFVQPDGETYCCW